MTSEMQAMIFDIKRFAIHDGPGIRTTVFFKGCPLSCWWCHNPESQSFQIQTTANQTFGKKVKITKLFQDINKDRIFFEESHGGVTFSGGEPLAQFDAVLELAKICSENMIHTTLDTCGYCDPAIFPKIVPYINTFLYDIKLFDNNLHKKYIGVGNKWIFQNLRFLDKHQMEIIIRIPVIPTINTTEKEIKQIIKFLKNFSHIHKVDLLSYHKTAQYKYQQLERPYLLQGISEPSSREITKIKTKFQTAGFEVSIGG